MPKRMRDGSHTGEKKVKTSNPRTSLASAWNNGAEKKFINFFCNGIVIDQTAEVLGTGASGDLQVANDVGSPVANVTHFTEIGQNSTACGRIGRKVRLTEITGRIILTFTPTATGQSQNWTTLRLVLVQDKQANGAIPTPVNIAGTGNAVFQNVQSSTTLVGAQPSMFNEDRFKILIDKQIVFEPAVGWTSSLTSGTMPGGPYSATNAGAGASQARQWNFKKKLNIPVEYDTQVATGGISSVRSNSLIMLVGSDNVDDQCRIGGTFRVRYVDA